MMIRQTLLKTVDKETDTETTAAVEMCNTWHIGRHTGKN
jgi:hypothetical protein